MNPFMGGVLIAAGAILGLYLIFFILLGLRIIPSDQVAYIFARGGMPLAPTQTLGRVVMV